MHAAWLFRYPTCPLRPLNGTSVACVPVRPKRVPAAGTRAFRPKIALRHKLANFNFSPDRDDDAFRQPSSNALIGSYRPPTGQSGLSEGFRLNNMAALLKRSDAEENSRTGL